MKIPSFSRLAWGFLLLLISTTPCWAQKHGSRLLLEDYPEPETDVVPHSPTAHVLTPTHPRKPALTGYWTVETTFTSENYSVVRFYDSCGTPLYTERLADFLPDFNKRTRRRAFRHLSVVLEHVLREPLTPASTTTLLAQQLQSRGRKKPAALDDSSLANTLK
jgi:hypothetical protein